LLPFVKRINEDNICVTKHDKATSQSISLPKKKSSIARVSQIIIKNISEGKKAIVFGQAYLGGSTVQFNVFLYA